MTKRLVIDLALRIHSDVASAVRAARVGGLERMDFLRMVGDTWDNVVKREEEVTRALPEVPKPEK